MDFNLRKVGVDTLDAVLRPQRYFVGQSSEANFSEPVFKVFLYGVASAAIHYVLKLAQISPPVLQSVEQADPMTTLFATPALYVLMLFFGAAFLLIVAALAGGRKEYALCVHCTAGLMALQPLSALANVGYVTLWGGALANLAVSLYWVWMLYHALIQGLNCRRGGSLAVCGLMIVLSAGGCYSLLRKIG
jgi:uncharacterized membrane protein